MLLSEKDFSSFGDGTGPRKLMQIQKMFKKLFLSR